MEDFIKAFAGRLVDGMTERHRSLLLSRPPGVSLTETYAALLAFDEALATPPTVEALFETVELRAEAGGVWVAALEPACGAEWLVSKLVVNGPTAELRDHRGVPLDTRANVVDFPEGEELYIARWSRPLTLGVMWADTPPASATLTVHGSRITKAQ